MYGKQEQLHRESKVLIRNMFVLQCAAVAPVGHRILVIVNEGGQRMGRVWGVMAERREASSLVLSLPIMPSRAFFLREDDWGRVSCERFWTGVVYHLPQSFGNFG